MSAECAMAPLPLASFYAVQEQMKQNRIAEIHRKENTFWTKQDDPNNSYLEHQQPLSIGREYPLLAPLYRGFNHAKKRLSQLTLTILTFPIVIFSLTILWCCLDRSFNGLVLPIMCIPSILAIGGFMSKFTPLRKHIDNLHHSMLAFATHFVFASIVVFLCQAILCALSYIFIALLSPEVGHNLNPYDDKDIAHRTMLQLGSLSSFIVAGFFALILPTLEICSWAMYLFPYFKQVGGMTFYSYFNNHNILRNTSNFATAWPFITSGLPSSSHHDIDQITQRLHDRVEETNRNMLSRVTTPQQLQLNSSGTINNNNINMNNNNTEEILTPVDISTTSGGISTHYSDGDSDNNNSTPNHMNGQSIFKKYNKDIKHSPRIPQNYTTNITTTTTTTTADKTNNYEEEEEKYNGNNNMMMNNNTRTHYTFDDSNNNINSNNGLPTSSTSYSLNNATSNDGLLLFPTSTSNLQQQLQQSQARQEELINLSQPPYDTTFKLTVMSALLGFITGLSVLVILTSFLTMHYKSASLRMHNNFLILLAMLLLITPRFLNLYIVTLKLVLRDTSRISQDDDHNRELFANYGIGYDDDNTTDNQGQQQQQQQPGLRYRGTTNTVFKILLPHILFQTVYSFHIICCLLKLYSTNPVINIPLFITPILFIIGATTMWALNLETKLPESSLATGSLSFDDSTDNHIFNEVYNNNNHHYYNNYQYNYVNNNNNNFGQPPLSNILEEDSNNDISIDISHQPRFVDHSLFSPSHMSNTTTTTTFTNNNNKTNNSSSSLPRLEKQKTTEEFSEEEKTSHH